MRMTAFILPPNHASKTEPFDFHSTVPILEMPEHTQSDSNPNLAVPQKVKCTILYYESSS